MMLSITLTVLQCIGRILYGVHGVILGLVFFYFLVLLFSFRLTTGIFLPKIKLN